MAEPGHLPPVPHHLSSRSPGRSAGAYPPPPPPTRKPYQQQQPLPHQQQQHQQPQAQVAAASFNSSSYPSHSEIQPALVTAEEPSSHKAVRYKKPWGSGILKLFKIESINNFISLS